MIVPTIPETPQVLDENGRLNDIWYNFFLQFTQLLRQNFGTEGLIVPAQPTSNIVQLTDPSKTPSGTMLYDTTLNEFKGNVAGVFKTFTLT